MSLSRAVAEWQRSRECMAAAWLCQRNGLYADAVSRAYYAVMHAVKAALELQDIQVENHNGVRNLFGRHIVVPARMESRWAEDLRFLFEIRIDADYEPEVTFTATQGEFACERAAAFLNRVISLMPGDFSGVTTE